MTRANLNPAEIVEAYRSGFSITQLARQYRTAKPRISSIVHQAQIARSPGSRADDITTSRVLRYYRSGLSFNAVARKTGIGVATVRGIIHREAPDMIRSPTEQLAVRAEPHDLSFTLASMDLHSAGSCTSCRVPIVSEAEERKQRCGFCAAPAWFGNKEKRELRQ